MYSTWEGAYLTYLLPLGRLMMTAYILNAYTAVYDGIHAGYKARHGTMSDL